MNDYLKAKDFLAKYPKITDESLQQKLLDKTEFTIIGQENDLDGIYYTFQVNIGILLSPVTPYKKMLFYLEPGVGKTCTSILVHELAKEFLNQFRRPTIVITRGQTLEDNYKTEFIKRCPGIEQHFPLDEKGKVRDKLGLRRELNQNFTFKKYGSLTTLLEKASDEWIKSTFSNRTFVLDEIQALKNGGKMYKQFQRMFDLVENVTIIGMSGTPNTDHPSEAVRLINLFKSPEERMVTGKKFMKRFYKDNKFLWEKEQELIDFYTGYVTYLQQTSDIVKTRFVENPKLPSDFQDFATYNLRMSTFQSEVYDRAVKTTQRTLKKTKGEMGIGVFQRDEQGNILEYESQAGGAFMKLAREAAMFVYPDKTFGAAGFKKNMTLEGKKLKFRDTTMEKQVIDNITQYSVSFAKSFELIKADPTRVFYIYFDNVNNSGLDLYAKLLELTLGFVQTDGKSSVPTKKARYVKIKGSGNSTHQVEEIIKRVGDKANAKGEIIRVVLGSPVSGIGLTIPNATRVLVFDSQFTPSDIVQIVGRINRPGSLKNLVEAGLPTDCEAYLFTSSTKAGESADLDIYKIAQDKNVVIKPQTVLMQRSDPLCAVSAARNGQTLVSGQDPSKDAQVCSTAKKERGKFRRHKDTTTDVLYWKRDEIEALKADIMERVVVAPIQITEYLSKYDKMLIYRAVKEISTSPKTIGNGLVFISGDLIFIDKTLSGDPNAAWFVEKQIFPNDSSIEDLIIQEELEKDQPMVEKVLSGDLTDFKKLSKHTQIVLYESSWNVKNPVSKKIKKMFTHYEIDGRPVHILSAEPIVTTSTAIMIEDKTKLREYINGAWQNFRGDVDELIAAIKGASKAKQQKDQEEVDQSYGIMGKYDKLGNFQIVVIGKGTGRRATFYSVADQKEFIKKLRVKMPADFESQDAEKRSAILEQMFKDKNLVKF